MNNQTKKILLECVKELGEVQAKLNTYLDGISNEADVPKCGVAGCNDIGSIIKDDEQYCGEHAAELEALRSINNNRKDV